jgi:hypothetical protein
MKDNQQQIVPGISVSSSGQASVDSSLVDALFELALQLEGPTDLPVDVEHVLAAIVLAARNGELAPDKPLTADDPALAEILAAGGWGRVQRASSSLRRRLPWWSVVMSLWPHRKRPRTATAWPAALLGRQPDRHHRHVLVRRFESARCPDALGVRQMSSYPYDVLPVRRAASSTDWKSVVPVSRQVNSHLPHALR